METLLNCQVCNQSTQVPFLSCKDYTVSRETFSIVSCAHCGFNFTNPRPGPSELGRYYQSEAYISHSNNGKGLINGLYKLIRKYTLIKKLQLINRLNGYTNPSKQLLDIGSGTGEFIAICKAGKWKVIGIEPSETAAMYARNNYKLTILPEEEINNLQDNHFDIITMWHVLEHVPELNKRIEDLKRLIKPRGTIIIAVPNHSSADAKHYKEFWAAYDVPRHLYHFTPDTIKALFNKHDLSVKQVLPMRFDSFYVSMLSEKYINGKPNLIKAIWNGFKSNISAIRSGETFSSQIYIIKPN
jgi:2-polyprenyl-3-methyl-5-hydroxy-6-metoxy-1,4-benzoquinol methylase